MLTTEQLIRDVVAIVALQDQVTPDERDLMLNQTQYRYLDFHAAGRKYWKNTLGETLFSFQTNQRNPQIHINSRNVWSPLVLAYTVTHELGHLLVDKNLTRNQFMARIILGDDGHGAGWQAVVRRLGEVPYAGGNQALVVPFQPSSYNSYLWNAFSKLQPTEEMIQAQIAAEERRAMDQWADA